MLKFTRKIKTSQNESTTTKFSMTASFVGPVLAGLGAIIAILLQNWPL